MFQQLVKNQLFEWDFCVVQWDTFYPRKSQQIKFLPKIPLFFLGWFIRDAEATFYLKIAEKFNLSTKI